MSKPLTKTDLKTLAKYIVDETKKYNEEDSIKKEEKDNKKRDEKLNKILQDEDSKNNFIEEFLTDVMDQDEDIIDIDYMCDLNKGLFNKLEGLEELMNDMNREVKQYTKKLYEKYSYSINQKLISKGY